MSKYFLVNAGTDYDPEISVFTDEAEAEAYAKRCGGMVSDSFPPAEYADCWQVYFLDRKFRSIRIRLDVKNPPKRGECVLLPSFEAGGDTALLRADDFKSTEFGFPDFYKVIDRASVFLNETVWSISPPEFAQQDRRLGQNPTPHYPEAESCPED